MNVYTTSHELKTAKSENLYQQYLILLKYY